MNSIIVLKENDYMNLRYTLPANSTILIVSTEVDQLTILNNMKRYNINTSTGDITSRLDQFIISFLRSNQHPTYESDDAYNISIDDDTLWNAFDNVKISIKMIKDGIFSNNIWKGPVFRGHISEGMEWHY